MSLKRAPELEQTVPKKKLKLLRKVLFEKHFKIGDYVKIPGKIYTIRDYSRATVTLTYHSKHNGSGFTTNSNRTISLKWTTDTDDKIRVSVPDGSDHTLIKYTKHYAVGQMVKYSLNDSLFKAVVCSINNDTMKIQPFGTNDTISVNVNSYSVMPTTHIVRGHF